jgi:hypothetical protein
MMIIFGFLTFKNVRQSRRRINALQTANTSIPTVATAMARYSVTQEQPTNITIGPNAQSSSIRANRTTQKRDVQLITMLLVQVSSREKVKRRNYFSNCLFF